MEMRERKRTFGNGVEALGGKGRVELGINFSSIFEDGHFWNWNIGCKRLTC